MLGVDTETTGLALQNGATTFAIGMWDGSKFNSIVKPIDPLTRYRTHSFNRSARDRFESEDMWVFHNAHLDIKALCEATLFEWDEPNEPEFWSRICDTTMLGHLYCSTDELSLDVLTQKYLDKGYPEDKLLIKTVDACRTLVRKLRPDWLIAEEDRIHPSFNSCQSSNKWNRMDFWLPAAVLKHIPQHQRPNLPDKLLATVMLEYLKADCRNTFELAEFYLHHLIERHGDKLDGLLNINKRIDHVTWKMEISGLHVRPTELDEAINACDTYIETLTGITNELSGRDGITDAELRILLFDEWHLKPVNWTKGGVTKKKQPSVDAATILSLHKDADIGSKEHRYLGCLLSLRKYEKKLATLSSFKKAKTATGTVYPLIFVTGTKTVRVSVKNPAIQTITKASNPYEDDAPDIAKWLEESPPMRSVFGPRDGFWWWTFDYSQIQLRIFANVTGEQEMMDAYDQGYDAHDFVARKIFGIPSTSEPTKAQRRVAKNVNFGFIFGASPKKIEKTAGIPGLWDTVTSIFPNAHAFIEQTKAEVNEFGYIETLGGYPLELKSHINKWNGRWEKAAHAGVNYRIQGAEAVIVKRAMRLCDDYLVSEFPAGRLALMVHDEMIFEVPIRSPKRHVIEIKRIMESAALFYGITVPVSADLVTRRWDKEIKVKL